MFAVVTSSVFFFGCSSSTTGGTSSSSGSPASGGVSIVNLVYNRDGASPTAFQINFTFGLQNGMSSAIETISTFALDVGDAHVESHISTDIADDRCTDPGGAAWKVAAGARSGTIDGFYFNGCGIDHICLGAKDEECSFAAPPPAMYSGPITLTLKGTLADSTPFTATGTGMPQ